MKSEISSGDCQRILIRATNWVGDAVMSLPALRAVRQHFPAAHITVLARPWVADVYHRERCVDRLEPYPAGRGARDWPARWRAARRLRSQEFDCALILPNSFESAATVRLAGIRRRVGYARDARGWLLTDPIPVPARGSIPRHESYYYLELVRLTGWLNELPEQVSIHLDGLEEARENGRRQLEARGLRAAVVGASPGAAFGTAKRWLPERFAEAASRLARELDADVAVFGTAGERELCELVARQVAGKARRATNLAGATSLREFIDLAAACRVFLTNDSGSMHIASAVGTPTVAVFGATDADATGPRSGRARVVRRPVDCAPCLLRDCPIDHRCMQQVTVDQVAETALSLLK